VGQVVVSERMDRLAEEMLRASGGA